MTVGGGLPDSMVTLFAVAAGIAVANIYYAQPLLKAIATEFGVGSGTAALVVTATTVGYTAGLALVVPLGDVISRRPLVVTLLLITAVSLAACALAPTMPVLIGISVVLAVSAVVAPLLVSFAATLATSTERGRVTGRVMSGVLMGVLLARTGGGLIAQWGGGWRTVYAVAAVLMLVLAGVLARTLPDVPVADRRLSYLPLLRSVAAIVREEPVLRLRCLYGFICFAGFSAFWTSLAFLLAKPPYGYDEAVIGLFGLLGAIGAYAARVTGRLVDAGRDQLVAGVLLTTILLSWGLLALHGGGWLPALIVAVITLDLGVQGMQVTNLSVVYRLRPDARNRITMAYMTTYFLGGVVGSAASGAMYSAYGWPGVCLAGAGLALLALLIWIAETVLRGRRRTPAT
ncbi:MAG TPA: MFS transporter [Pseudonocardiaceae bacterium]|jgi:predicted MFS family arabinose efflux permease|nr:MFS transporter [Pseudonocardiaceae bacterium]